MASFDFNRRSFGTEPASLGVSAWGGRRLMDGTGSTSGVIAIAASSSATGSAAPPVPLAPPDRQPSDLKLPEPAPRKAGWAIVGLGQLALEEVIPAFRACRLSQPVALVSGHSEKAHTVADAYGIEHTNIYDYESSGAAECKRVPRLLSTPPKSPPRAWESTGPAALRARPPARRDGRHRRLPRLWYARDAAHHRAERAARVGHGL